MDTTSSNVQQSRKHDHSRQDKQDFITHEIEVTREAMKSAAADIWQQVPTTDDVAAWTKANPLVAVGIAAGAGVLAGFMVTPSRGGARRRAEHHDDRGGGGVMGAMMGVLMPAVSMAGKAALSAAVAHFTSQQVAEETADETARDAVSNEYADASVSATEAA